MTNQDIFDRVISHLIEQGEPSFDEHQEGLYRGPNNLTCGVGCLIPDDSYMPEMEGHCIEVLLQQIVTWKLYALLAGTATKEERAERRSLLDDVQEIHDDCLHWNASGLNLKGRNHARQVAINHNLSSAILDLAS